MPQEGDVAAGYSGYPVRAGKQRPETGCHAPGRRTWTQASERWTSRRPGPHLDQNVLGQLRRGSPGLDSGPLRWPLFRCRTARSAPAPLFGANVALENRD